VPGISVVVPGVSINVSANVSATAGVGGVVQQRVAPAPVYPDAPATQDVDLSGGPVFFNYLWRLNEEHTFRLKERDSMSMMGMKIDTDVDMNFSITTVARLDKNKALFVLQVHKLLVTQMGVSVDLGAFPPEQLRMTGEIDRKGKVTLHTIVTVMFVEGRIQLGLKNNRAPSKEAKDIMSANVTMQTAISMETPLGKIEMFSSIDMSTKASATISGKSKIATVSEKEKPMELIPEHLFKLMQLPEEGLKPNCSAALDIGTVSMGPMATPIGQLNVKLGDDQKQENKQGMGMNMMAATGIGLAGDISYLFDCSKGILLNLWGTFGMGLAGMGASESCLTLQRLSSDLIPTNPLPADAADPFSWTPKPQPGGQGGQGGQGGGMMGDMMGGMMGMNMGGGMGGMGAGMGGMGGMPGMPRPGGF